jgi:hypothetical protein
MLFTSQVYYIFIDLSTPLEMLGADCLFKLLFKTRITDLHLV